ADPSAPFIEVVFGAELRGEGFDMEKPLLPREIDGLVIFGHRLPRLAVDARVLGLEQPQLVKEVLRATLREMAESLDGVLQLAQKRRALWSGERGGRAFSGGEPAPERDICDRRDAVDGWAGAFGLLGALERAGGLAEREEQVRLLDARHLGHE